MHSDSDRSWPDLPTATPSTAELARAGVERPGTVIGRYMLIEQIGAGGFGAALLAEQREPVTRKVALKILKLGLDTRQVIARFEQERETLALMDHPHIAKALDADATELGRPYFVMERVDGQPITRHCDEHALTVRQRLELFESSQSLLARVPPEHPAAQKNFDLLATAFTMTGDARSATSWRSRIVAPPASPAAAPHAR